MCIRDSRHSRDDPREDVGVGVGVVECELKYAEYFRIRVRDVMSDVNDSTRRDWLQQ